MIERSPVRLGILEEIAAERRRQEEKWGEQNHPDGTGGETAVHRAWHARAVTDSKAQTGTLTWRDIFYEEVAEALAEEGKELREELIQAAAVIVNWIEAIDRRK